MSRNHPELTPAVVQQLILDTEPWLSCDDCFRLVDQYVELLLQDSDAKMPAMKAHLEGCAACAEEAQSLLELAAEDAGLDPAPALSHLPGR